ncbi:MAG TPA: hypothetical protein VI112_11180 [Bacteroidia bacterium]|jgi:hypothetical protein
MNPILDEELDEDAELTRLKRIEKIFSAVEYVLFAGLVIGYLFRIQHWPYSWEILFTTLGFICFLQVLKLFYLPEKLNGTIKAIAFGVMATGFYMSYLHYQSASAVTSIGLLLYLAFRFIGMRNE